MEKKSYQRKEMIDILKAMDPAEHQQKSDMILKSLMADRVFQDSKVIGLTISSFPEVDTHHLLEECWKAGKKTVVPKCDPLTREMTFRAIEDYSQLETVYMKLMEPIVEKTEKIEPDEIDLLIVPGVLFSKDGYRIGFGGGYYDRYLTRYTGPTCSLAFSMQLVESLPIEAHDLPVQKIFTENGCQDRRRMHI